MNLHYVALGGAILVGVGGQLLFKVGTTDSGSVIAQFLRPPVAGGMLLYLASMFLYVVALRQIPVSIAYPSVSLSYVLMAGLDYFLFKEPLGLMKLGGIMLVIAGVTLLHYSD